ncbi:AAA family ATPase [Bradyrhizobium sp. WU425]|uniref:AAA family ATPase n=1 Tax=Bradyrhizobium sp. WU425 TaxID=187029 RepID=UPI001E2E695B|nr:AAA family ATPase [Bradyrhizobium canariense]UFW69202.1 AAA family ATPase [Bradyrhizobium canariense]
MSKKQLVARPLDSFRAKQITWLFEPFIPQSYITTICGDGAVGKSTMIYDIIARLTVGRPMPSFGEDAPAESSLSGSAIILSKEDDPRAMMRTRLEAAGANLSKVRVIGTSSTADAEDFNVIDRIDTKLGEIENLIREIGDVRVIVLDPLTDFAGDLSMYRDDQVRQLLTPLAELARRYKIAVINVLHTVKGTKRKAREHILGSVGLVNISRSVLLVGKSLGSDQTLLMTEKANLVRDKKSVAFAIRSGLNQQPVVEWAHEWEDDVDPNVILSKPTPHVTKQQKAAIQLCKALRDGPKPANEMRELASVLGLHFNTIKAAKKEIGIRSERRDDGWWWSLPKLMAPVRRERLVQVRRDRLAPVRRERLAPVQRERL